MKRSVFFLLWCATFLFLSAKHVPWRDEFQSWLVSTRTADWSAFFETVRYERHPPLHYLLERGVFRLLELLQGWGLPLQPWDPFWFRALTSLFSAGTVAILLFGFQAPLLFGIGVPSGILFLLDYGIISRTYIIGIFFLFAAALARARKRPGLFALFLLLSAGTHLYFTLICGAIYLLHLWDSRQELVRGTTARKATTALVLLGFAGVLLYQAPPPDSYFPTHASLSRLSLRALAGYLVYGLTGLDSAWGTFRWNQAGLHWLFIFPVIFLLRHMRREGFPLGRYFLIAAMPLGIMSLAYAPALRHVGVLWVLLLALLMLNGPPGTTQLKVPRATYVFIALMALSSARWLVSWAPWKETPAFDLSGQQELSAALGARLTPGASVLAVANDAIYFPVMGALNIEVFHVPREKTLAHPYFRTSEHKTDLHRWCATGGPARLAATLPGKTVYLGLAHGETPPEACGNTEKIFESSRPIMTDEAYAVHRLITR
ncbi:MAG: hypothetical protein NDJ89_14655 [Oligoflexia bacterium]|nr:hypothetical protein [Oligoflexia bacterium]